KVCLDDARAVRITSPGEASIVTVGDMLLVTWETQEYCEGFTATARVSYDNGYSWRELASGRQILSALWKVANLDGATPIIQVTVEDAGDVRSDQVALNTSIRAARHVPPNRQPAQHD